MNRLSVATDGTYSWKSRLASPNRQWRRRFSAMETAISWEIASNSNSGFATLSGMPTPIAKLLEDSDDGELILLSAVAEHKVELPGGTAASQCDVWAIVKTSVGLLSLTVEAKANEPFGNETLKTWLVAGKTEASKSNRQIRWEYILSHLPSSTSYSDVRYQLLHRCAAAVIEAKRYRMTHAAFIVQAFESPETSFQDYAVFCKALNITAGRDHMETISVNGISLSVGWAECQFATNDEVIAAK